MKRYSIPNRHVYELIINYVRDISDLEPRAPKQSLMAKLNNAAGKGAEYPVEIKLDESAAEQLQIIVEELENDYEELGDSLGIIAR